MQWLVSRAWRIRSLANLRHPLWWQGFPRGPHAGSRVMEKPGFPRNPLEASGSATWDACAGQGRYTVCWHPHPPRIVVDDTGGLPWQLGHLNLLEVSRAGLRAHSQLTAPFFIPYRSFVEPDMAVLAWSNKHLSPPFRDPREHCIAIPGFARQSNPRLTLTNKLRLLGMPSPGATKQNVLPCLLRRGYSDRRDVVASAVNARRF